MKTTHESIDGIRKVRNRPSFRIVFICGPVISTPASVSSEIPDEVMLKGNTRGGEIGDFATFMNLSPENIKILIKR